MHGSRRTATVFFVSSGHALSLKKGESIWHGNVVCSPNVLSRPSRIFSEHCSIYISIL